MDRIALWLGIFGGIVGLVGAAVGLISWYSGAVQKRYASQRDFEHLKNNQKAISLSVADIDRQIERILNDLEAIRSLVANLPEIKAYVMRKD